MATAVIQASNITFAYNTRPILRDVSLAAGAGEIVGIIGPNGSGKSTLLRVLSGVLRPKSGALRVGGEDIARLSCNEVARRLAVVPQSPHLPEAFTAGEVVLLGRTPHLGLLRGESARDMQVVREAMAACGVAHLADRRIGELSGGETQRVVIARALAQEPQVLLLDEPTSHLDINHQCAVLNLVSTLSRERGLAVVAVFHDLNLAVQYCHRLAILSEGRLLAEGTPAEVVTVENVKRAYGAEVCIVSHPRNHLPVALITGTGTRPAGENE